ncbi:MAG: gas vesicle protein [Streptosporangiales bacterium]|nr:gas vesicle protein [Streptosporangiales bacterium]
MTEPTAATSRAPAGYRQPVARRTEPANLADILERVLDKGIVIAGDIRVNLLDIELLTIKLRLIVASVDRAKEMGIDWWEHDPTLSSKGRDLADENRRLRERVEALESGEAGHSAEVLASRDGRREVDPARGTVTGSEVAAAEEPRHD